MKKLSKDVRSDEGAAAVEYALVVGLISLVIVAAVVVLRISFTDWASTVVETVGDLLS